MNETLETLYLYDLPKNVFEAATKENIQTQERKSKYERKPVLIKVLALFNYWCNQMEKFIATVKMFLVTSLIYAISQPTRNVPTMFPYGPILVETSRAILGPK